MPAIKPAWRGCRISLLLALRVTIWQPCSRGKYENAFKSFPSGINTRNHYAHQEGQQMTTNDYCIVSSYCDNNRI